MDMRCKSGNWKSCTCRRTQICISSVDGCRAAVVVGSLVQFNCNHNIRISIEMRSPLSVSESCVESSRFLIFSLIWGGETLIASTSSLL